MNPHKSEEESLSDVFLTRTHFVKKRGGRNLFFKETPIICGDLYIVYFMYYIYYILYVSTLHIYIPVFFYVYLVYAFILYSMFNNHFVYTMYYIL